MLVVISDKRNKQHWPEDKVTKELKTHHSHIIILLKFNYV